MFSGNFNITNKQNYCKGFQGKWAYFTKYEVFANYLGNHSRCKRKTN